MCLSDTDGDNGEDAEFTQQNKGPKYKDQLKQMAVKNRTWNFQKQMPSNNLIRMSRSRTASISHSTSEHNKVFSALRDIKREGKIMMRSVLERRRRKKNNKNKKKLRKKTERQTETQQHAAASRPVARGQK